MDRADEQRIQRPARTQRDAHSGRYARLTQLGITHRYYAGLGTDDACPDFVASPTPPTRDLMRALGLLFRRDAAGFSILYDTARKDGLLWFLREHGGWPSGSDGVPEHWTRLSFVLALSNLQFINFTAIPADTNPSRQNLYFTNQDSHRRDARILLAPGNHVTGEALLPLAGPQIQVATPPEVVEVLARDISGEVVTRALRCVPQPPGPPVCRDFVFLDLSAFPEGRYTIEKLGLTPPWPARDIIYTVASPLPLCFIDLLLARPTALAKGIYPVENLDQPSKTSITGVRYELHFDARATHWRYYIQPPPRERLEDLAIDTMGTVPPVTFAGPVPVKLVNGHLAYRFVSEDPLGLRRRSPFHFKLKGRRAMRVAAGDDVLTHRLAVADAAQFVPEPEAAGFSDIYVSL
jgi:hypothetical protein